MEEVKYVILSNYSLEIGLSNSKIHQQCHRRRGAGMSFQRDDGGRYWQSGRQQRFERPTPFRISWPSSNI